MNSNFPSEHHSYSMLELEFKSSLGAGGSHSMSTPVFHKVLSTDDHLHQNCAVFSKSDSQASSQHITVDFVQVGPGICILLSPLDASFV